MPGEQTAVAEAPPPEVPPEDSQDTQLVSEQVAEAVPQEDVEAEQLPEQVAEAEPETPEDIEQQARAYFDALPEAVREGLLRQHGEKSAAIQEIVRRREQAARDRTASEQQRAQAQKQEMDRILQIGRQAIGDIDQALSEVEQGIQDGTAKMDRGRILRAINGYRDAWAASQALTWNQEVQNAFLSLEPVVGAMTEEDFERLSNAGRAANRAQNRAPLLNEMLQVVLEKGLVLGYDMSQQDLQKYAQARSELEEKRDALTKLRKVMPTASPQGTPARLTSDQELLRQAGEGEDVDMKRLERILDQLE